MDLQNSIDGMIGGSDDRKKIQSVRSLAPFTHNPRVVDALCEAAVTTDSDDVRDALIEVLKNNSAGAFSRFSDYALWSQNPASRKWALVNLRLMGCGEAKDAVISGLYDPDASVRRAAAMSTGLYVDIDVQNALERYYESHRFALTLSFIADGLRSMKIGAEHLEDDDYSRIPADTQAS